MQAEIKRVKYITTYIKENTNLNENGNFIVRSCYRRMLNIVSIRGVETGNAATPSPTCHKVGCFTVFS